MIAVPLHIELSEPVLATALEGDPNSATSYPFIPGSLIRGALATRYWKSHQVKDLAADPKARSLFFEGSTRFLNAYPLDAKGDRMLPVPLSWRMEKGSEAPTLIYDWSIAREEGDLEVPKPVGSSFCCLKYGAVELGEPLRRVAVHTQRDRQMGRATEDSGAVFRYEALAPGQVFEAAILFEDQATADLLAPHIEGMIFLGGSRSAGYGAASISPGKPSASWQEVEHPGADIPAGQSFTLVLLSDALLRSEDGQCVAMLDLRELAARLGVSSLTLVDSFKQSGLVGGFNRKWGLPLPQVPVLRAGSVFVLQAGETITAGAISGLEQHGIGYRRAEGLGRVAVNWLVDEELQLPKPVEEEPKKRNDKLVGDGQRIASVMIQRLADSQIEGSLTHYLNNLRFQPRGISPNQLARLRVLVRSAQREGDIKRVYDWLEEMGPRTPARRQLETARVRGERLWRWLKARCDDPATVWAELGLNADSLPSLGQERVELSGELAHKVALRLVDGVLARAIKEIKADD